MKDWRPRMQAAVRHLAEQVAAIRPGAPGAGFVDSFRVPIGGQAVPVGKLASTSAKGGRVLVRPFDPAHVPAVVKALTEARLSAYAADPRTVAVGVPPISGEQRAETARHVKKLGEEAKIAVRMIRQDARKQIAARGHGSGRAVQEATDAAVEEIDRIVKAKIAEVGP